MDYLNMDKNDPCYNADAAKDMSFRKLYDAFIRFQEMHFMVMDKVDWGKSFFDAKCIKELNEAPIQAAQAIKIAEKHLP